MMELTDPADAGSPVHTVTHGRPGASLEIRQVTKLYDGSAPAVDDVSLDVAAGEFMTFLGPSGSGKTTTLNMIAGFADVTSGQILMDGAPIEQRPPHKRDIGMVFQSYALFPHLTVAENVAFPLKRRRVAKPEIADRVAEALRMVQLEGLGGRYPNQLSGGQQQRVALARAIVFRPRVLLMDEPLGALDKKLREWLQLEIKRIHRELGITFVYVTHDQEEALVLSDRIAVFCDGRIEQVGSADDLYLRPVSRFVAEFVGESNVFSGAVTSAPDVFVDEAGHEIRFSGAASDGRATVVVRPERVIVRARGLLPGDVENTLPGSVRQVIYLGAARKLEVELANGEIVVAREQAGGFSGAEEGDAVTVSWSVEDAALVRDDRACAATHRTP